MFVFIYVVHRVFFIDDTAISGIKEVEEEEEEEDDDNNVII